VRALSPMGKIEKSNIVPKNKRGVWLAGFAYIVSNSTHTLRPGPPAPE
jgi:hypothetical protein